MTEPKTKETPTTYALPADWWQKHLAEEKARNDKARKDADAVIAALKEAGVKDVVRIEFAGSGDSGSIGSIRGLNDGLEDHENDEGWGDDKKELPALRSLVIDWADRFAGSLGVDWWNNEGGNGWIEINMTPMKGKKVERITYAVYQNVVEEGDSGSF